MKREILINAAPRETRIAILEDGKLVELLVDRPDSRRMVGDIYLGRVDAVPSSISGQRRALSSTRLTSSGSQPTKLRMTTTTTTMTRPMKPPIAATATPTATVVARRLHRSRKR
jgi:hypothetical protein